jgi:hypothetical protein
MTRSSRFAIGAGAIVFALLLIGFLPSAVEAQAFVQVGSATPSAGSQVATAYALAQVSGDLNVVVVGWSDTTAAVTSVTDTVGNVYNLAVGPMAVSGQVSQSIYYARNIAAAAPGTNTVTVNFSTVASYPDLRILEYSGLDVNNPLDAAAGATGSTAANDSGAVAATTANDLLVGANTVATTTDTAGSGYTMRIITDPDGDLVEDRVVTASGSYHATATLSYAGPWVMQLVAFRAAGAAPAPTAPTNLAATAVSSTQINLSWTASTEAGGTISDYLVERCAGAGCTNFLQVNTSATTTFNDTGLSSGTSYSYRVRAQDTANNLSPYSNTAAATTQGSPLPTAPGNLTATAGGSGPVVLATQSYINSTSMLSHTTAPFDITGGDLIVMAASSHAGVTLSPSDSFGNVWVSAAGPTSTTQGFDLRTQVWYVRTPTVGPGHTVTMNLSVSQPLVISIFVVKNSNTSSPIDAISVIGNDAGTQTTNVTTPNITTTSTSNLLIAFAKSSIGEVWTAGTGFTPQPAASSNYLDAETGFAAAPGTYNATFTINAAATWQAAVVAVTPSAAAANPNQANLSWTASTETGGTISNYLVERCQGSGCSNFGQVGTSTTTTFNDTGVTSGNSYVYRVRAQDATNSLGLYSNTTTITMP